MNCDRGSRAGLSVFLTTLMILSGFLAGVPQAKAAAVTDPSWNPQSAYCTAIVTTLETVIGSQTNSFGGATYAGGGFKPGIPDKRSLSPPCTAGVPPNATFVEIHNVEIPSSVSLRTNDCIASTSYCDQKFDLQDLSCPSKDLNLCRITAEIDQRWEQSGFAPVNPPNNTLIDIQGFVYNDTENTVLSGFHNYSPWEIHPLTAWRIAGETTSDFAVYFRSPIVIPQGSSGTSTINVLGFNGFKGDVTLSLAIPPGLTATLGSTVVHTVSFGQSTNTTLLTVNVPASIKPGNYLLNVTGTSGILSHMATEMIEVPYFTMSATPSSGTIQPNSTFTSTIRVASHNGFAGIVALTGSVSASGLAWSLNQNSLLVAAGGSNASRLTVSSQGTPTGVYYLTLVGTSGSLTSHATVKITVANFSISLSPSALNFEAGSFGASRIALTSLSSFIMNVTLVASVAPVGPAAKLFQNSLLLKPGGSNSTTVRVDASSPGTYVLNVTGIFGSLSHSVFVTVTVPGFAVSVIVGNNDVLYWSALSGGSWTGWSSVGFSSPSPPALCGSSGGRLDMIARGMNNVIYHLIFVNSVWSNSTHPWGTTLDQPVCAVLNGSLHIVVRGTDNGTWYNSMSLATSQWTGWIGLNGFTPSPPTLVVSVAADRLDLVVRGMADGIWHKAFLNGFWSAAWDSPGGATPSAPAAVSDGTVLHIVVRGLDNVTYYNSLSFSLGVWQGWVSLFGQTPSAPALAIDSSGTIHLVVQGMNEVPYHKSFSSGAWSISWDSPFGLTPNAPTAVALGTTLSMLVVGLSGTVYYNSLVSSSWSGWLGLGGSTTKTPALGIAQ